MPYSPSPDQYHDRRGPPKDWDAPEEEEGEISYSGRHTSSSSRGGSGGRDHRDRGYSDRRRDDRYRDGGSDRRDYRDRGDRGDRSERDYRDRERDKDRPDRDGRRRRSSRSRSRSRSPHGGRRGGGGGAGGGRSRSRSPRSKRGRRDDDDKEDGEYKSNSNNKDRKGSEKKSDSGKGGATDEDMAAPEELSPEDEEARMMALMGFGGFDSTKGKKVPGADVSGADIKKQRQYRQYMNRRGGFNRPLDAK